MSTESASMYRQANEELPHELILSIQRVLDIHPGPDSDPLDALTDDFNSVDVLNRYFPDGTAFSLFVFGVEAHDCVQRHLWVR